MRCERCGNENADTNRFCGMCGNALSASPAHRPPLQPTRAAASPVPTQPVPGPRPAASAHVEPRPVPRRADDAPIITGPSFLGLNQPGPSSGRGVSLRPAQDHLRSSRNLDYLLEDENEEEPKRRVGKVLLVLIALALALGFGYLRWRQGGFDWLTTGTTKSSPAQPSDASQPPSSSAATPSSSSPSTASQENASGSTAQTNSPAANPSSPAAAPAVSNAVPSSPAPSPDSGSTPNSPTANTPAPATPAGSDTPPPESSGSGAVATRQPASASDTTATTPDTEAPRPKPAPTKPTPAKPSDPVAAAEKYIYGRGVPQDCERGLHQLKPAAEQSDPKAMISLGALYATGVCTPRDLPTAYRWFALALRKQPDNQPLQESLQKIWAQMTPPERQLAIKLSQ